VHGRNGRFSRRQSIYALTLVVALVAVDEAVAGKSTRSIAAYRPGHACVDSGEEPDERDDSRLASSRFECRTTA
jgi:hypothetical protein